MLRADEQCINFEAHVTRKATVTPFFAGITMVNSVGPVLVVFMVVVFKDAFSSFLKSALRREVTPFFAL
jgi:hypothetical protein